MDERVHFIPVGFDFERLIFPISKGQLDADRVILVTHKESPDDVGGDDAQAIELAGNMTRRLENSFEMIDIEVSKIRLTREEMYDYEEVYQRAHARFLDELKDGNEVFVNISSMPRTVAFAFATAANTLITEKKDEIENIRNNLHTYYARPQRYVALEMLEQLEKEVEYLETVVDPRSEERRTELLNLVNKVKGGGVTRGTKNPPGSDRMYVEFPATPGSEVEGFEKKILYFLEREAPFSSTSDLAEALAEHLGKEYDGSFRSRVQYNVMNLDKKGYVDREKKGNRSETFLSTMGRMWVKTNEEPGS